MHPHVLGPARHLNPFRYFGVPAVAAWLVVLAAVGAGVAPLLILPGALLAILGTRLAYDHRGAGRTAIRLMRLFAPWNFWVVRDDVIHMRIVGGIIAAAGVGLVAAGAAAVP